MNRLLSATLAAVNRAKNITLPTHLVMGAMLGLGSLFAPQVALSACRDGLPGKYDTVTFNIPATLTLSPVPVGGVLARITEYMSYHSFHCENGDTFPLTLDVKGLQPSGIPNVYQTGVEGIGIRFGFTIVNSGTTPKVFPPTSVKYYPNVSATGWGTFNYGFVDLIRTGVAVGSQAISIDFTSRLTIPMEGGGTRVLTYKGSRSSVQLLNNNFFSGCKSTQPTTTVEMGRVATTHIRSGSAPQKNFSLDIKCEGLRPSTPIPVKIYFEGDAEGPGLLRLAAGGQGAAKGIGIKLENDKGLKLPFNKEQSIYLDWQRSEPNAEVYRFSGNAQYVPLAGEMKAGRGDASMSFVIDYN